MEPDKFRKSRQAINQICKNMNEFIDQKSLEDSKECYEEACSKLDVLKPQAEGEIQERSVNNLSMKINALSNHMGKLKPKKSAPRAGKIAKPSIEWDEERVGQLSPVFLKKLIKNMGKDTDAKVCFGTTGKGIRPSYQIEFGNQETTTFSGSGHKPQEKLLSGSTQKISQPFSYGVIDSILTKK